MNITEEQKLIQSSIRELVTEKIKPHAKSYDEQSIYPVKSVQALRSHEFLTMMIPGEYGGADADPLSYSLCVEEIARGCASTSTIFAANNSLVISPIKVFGTEEQKERFFPYFTRKDGLGAFALSEPHAGSDASSLSTKAILDGDEWVLNGSKFYITNASESNILVIFARSNEQKGHKGISAFVVPRDISGLTVLPPEQKLGIRASVTSAITLEDVRIPKTNLLGKEGSGIPIALSTLDKGRITIAAQSVGISQAAYDDALRYAKEREQFGKKIIKFSTIKTMLADMLTQLTASRLMYRQAINEQMTGKKITQIAAMAKLFASENATFITHKALQIHGGAGFLKDHEVERYYRDARITEIYEGTSEIMKLVISRSF